MRINKLFTAFFFLSLSLSVSAYDAVGHRIVADVAYANLTKTAQNQLDKILGKHGLIYAATWPDDIKSDKSYAYSYQWHYQNLRDSMSSEGLKQLLENPKSEGDHLFYAIDSLTNRLKIDRKDAEALKFLIHFIGDLHQPMHLGRVDDLGGNKVVTKWFGKTINIHSLWDSYLIEGHQMSYTEFSQYLQDKFEPRKAEIQKCSLLQSVEASYAVRNLIYGYDTSDTSNYHYSYYFNPKIDEMLYRGGIQLANVLNAIYK